MAIEVLDIEIAPATSAAPEGGTSAARDSGWYVVQVKPRQETRVVRRLSLPAVGTFLPFIEAQRRRGAGKVRTLEPLFPGYLFVRMAPPEADPVSWSKVRWSPGVVRVLSVGDTPVAVPPELVETIEARTRELGFVRLPSPLIRGARVRLTAGPFRDLEAVFDRPLSRAGRVLVLLQLLGQLRPVEVAEEWLDPA